MIDSQSFKLPTQSPKLTSGSTFRLRLRQFISLVKWLFTPLALAFLLTAIWQSRLLLRETLVQSFSAYLIFAVIMWMLVHLLSPVLVSVILNACGTKVCYRQTLELHLRNLPARYIPGGIWHTVARIGGLRQIGVPPRLLSSFVVLENLIAVGTALTAGGIVVGFHQQDGIWQSFAFLAAGISLIILVLCPVMVNRFILKNAGRIGYRRFLSLILVSSISWLFAATSFLLFLSALPNSYPTYAWLEIIGAYLFSWGVGFLAIFAPQGVGVFEVVAAAIMPTNLPFHAFIALVAGFRFVVILADMLMWSGWAVWKYR